MFRRAITLVIASLGVHALGSDVPLRPLTRAERIRAQETIERVYDAHRTWPAENPMPRPSFESRVPPALLEAKVDDYLRKSDALDAYWHRPITSGALQAEIDRMARDSKDPVMLAELVDALGRDPVLVAECLARPILAERLLHTSFAYDRRFHVEAWSSAERARRELTWENFESYPRGQAERRVYEVGTDEAPDAALSDAPRRIAVSEDGLRRLREELGAPGGVARLREREDRIEVALVTEASDERIEVLCRTFAKQSQSAWWESVRASLSPDPPGASGRVALPDTQRAGSAPCDEWKPTDALQGPPEQRAWHTAVWTGAEMIVWGGAPFTTVGGRYSPATDTWTATSQDGSPSRRAYHSAVWTGAEMIVWGGVNPYSVALKSGGRYSPLTDTWIPTSTTGSCPVGRGLPTAVWTGVEMIVWGGQATGGTDLQSGGRYAPATDTWVATSTGPACPSARSRHSGIWNGNELIVWGGIASGNTWLNTGGRYSPATDTWVATSTALGCPSARDLHSAIWTGGEMIVWGGLLASGTSTSTGGRYVPATDTWSPTSTGASCPTSRTQHTAVWSGTEMIVWGGNDDINGAVNDGARYDLASDTWTPTSTAAACPAARLLHTAVWTGSEMIVWGGGSAAGTFLNTGGRYSAVTDSWAATSLGTGPSARSRHTAVWTGAEMIVWGGVDEAAEINTGGRYDPTTDSWSPTQVGPACPSPRQQHTAVWTGSEMIVWGGQGSGGNYNTGGRYQPASDTWLATPVTAACPLPTSYHTAVWTGTEMIVWGGASYLPQGGRYSPATNTWMMTSTSGAPTARFLHVAIWSGSRMIVWGGVEYSNGFASVNTGGLYDPSTDAWLPTSTSGACPPGGEYFVVYHRTAVWTGSEMIVSGDWSYPDMAVRYSPSTDSWTGASFTGAPLARIHHTAVWTGSEMIIWGGYATGGGWADTGGRYTPATDTWRTTSGGGACPLGREAHTAVWTGSGMIVWGGDLGACCALNPVLGSGTAYRPIRVLPATLPDGGVGTPYAQTLSAAGSTPAYSFAVTAGALPAGLALSPAGVLSGTPATPGFSLFTVTATDANGCTGDYAYWLAIQAAGCAGAGITMTPSLPSGHPNAPYSQTITASGGSSPYTFALRDGSLPAGVSLSSAGVVSGVPTQVGVSTFTVAASDANGCIGAQRYSIAILAAPFCPGVSLSPASLPAGTGGVPYGQTITGSGGLAPYYFSVTSGAMPPGLTLSSGGVVAGTPAQLGSYTFEVTAFDSVGCSGRRTYVLVIGKLDDYVLGAGLGSTSPNEVAVWKSDGTAAGIDFFAYGAGAWGVNVGSDDVDGGGCDELLTGAGPGPALGPQLRAFDRAGLPISKVNFFAYATLRYGVNAGATRSDADAYAEILSGAGPGAVFGPHVRGWNYDGVSVLAIGGINYFAYGTLQYGVNIEGGDVDADGLGEILTGPGPGPTFGPQVRGWNVDGGSTTAIAKINFNAFGASGYGVNVAGGDVDGDLYAEIAAAPGPGPTAAFPSELRGFDWDLGSVTTLPGFDVTPFTTVYGGRVGLSEIAGAGADDLLGGAGRDPVANATVVGFTYDGTGLTSLPGSGFVPFGWSYGVNVAGGALGH
ncbi:MAG: putative Ig domain-containing protein [Acidobacteriota bacterium]